MPQENTAIGPDGQTGKPSRYRWMICGLLLAAIAINYTHRQMVGILKDPLSAEMGWTGSLTA
jgi:ACS family hexuronate transporter-like MFS transporter